jgi:hypothetical protein
MHHPFGILNTFSQNILLKKPKTTNRMKSLKLTFLFVLLYCSTYAQCTISTVYGNGTNALTGDGGQATNAQFTAINNIIFDANGNLFIAEFNTIRKVDKITGIISRIAGTGVTGFSGDNIAATTANFSFIRQMVFDANGDLYFCDANNNKIRKINMTTGILTTFAGTGVAANVAGEGNGGLATAAKLSFPYGLAFDTAGNLFFTDSNWNILRKINGNTGIISTEISVGLTLPGKVLIDANDNIFIRNGFGGDILKIKNGTILKTLTGASSYSADMIFNPQGNIITTANNIVSRVDTATNGKTAFVGNGTAGFSGDNGPATSVQLNNPTGLALDASGALFISDNNNYRIRKNVCTATNSCPEAGATWTLYPAAQANEWRSVAYGNGLFVAVANTGTNRVMTSPDGIFWTARTAAEANQWYSVTYGNGLFVAVAADGTNRVMTSPNGITWTTRTAPEANFWRHVTYGNGLFVAVATDGVNRVMTSPDGITWTARTAPEANSWISVVAGNGLFVAVALDGTNRIMTSPDGITWTARMATEANLWRSVGYGIVAGNGLFVALARTGTNRVMTSPDGITWTARMATVANVWTSITHANGLFVAVAQGGISPIMTSPDGVTWTAPVVAEPTGGLSVIYGNGLYVAVTFEGTKRVMTSPGGTVPTVSVTANITSATSVTFTATPANGGTIPTYQWKKNNINVGTNSATYTDASLTDNDKITCVLTSNALCALPTTANSNEITITICTVTAAPITTNISSGVASFTGNVVNATNQISNATVTITASQSVTLLSGFSAQNAVFTAQIGAAPNGRVQFITQTSGCN